MNARGRVTGLVGPLLEVTIPGAFVGAGMRVLTQSLPQSGTVRGVIGNRVYAALHGGTEGIAVGTVVCADERVGVLPLGTCALGRCFDVTGAALDDGPPIRGVPFAIDVRAPLPDERRAIEKPLWTGVKAIDSLLTIGVGARVGLFGAAGAGKTTLLETIVRGVRVDAVVVGLVGERGREAQQWTASCDRRTTIVCATSDRPAAERVRAAHVAVAQARALARRGLNVVVILDSLARFAAALRELAIAAGESPGRGGYPPSVFAAVARLLECCGTTSSGSITLLATVLSDGDDNDPVSDAARSLLDGHIALSSRLAHAGRFPAIDVLASASRTMAAVVDAGHSRAAQAVRAVLALLDRCDDARSLGIVPADEPTLRAIRAEAAIEGLLRQDAGAVAPALTLRMLAGIADTLEEPHGYSD